MTSEEVLTVLIDLWRQREHVDPGESIQVPLSRDTTVGAAADLIGLPKLYRNWIAIAKFLANLFRIQLDISNWREVLDPKEVRTIGPVCDLIASQALAPMIECTINGVHMDWPSAAFRTVRSIFSESGMSVRDIHPDTRLESYLQSRPDVFLNCISRLAPGRLPSLHSVNYLKRALLIAMSIAALWMVLPWFASALPIPHNGGFPLLVLVVCIVILVAGLPPRLFVRRYLGELSTFRELCLALTSPPPAYPQPNEPVDGKVKRWDASQYPIVDLDYFVVGG